MSYFVGILSMSLYVLCDILSVKYIKCIPTVAPKKIRLE